MYVSILLYVLVFVFVYVGVFLFVSLSPRATKEVSIESYAPNELVFQRGDLAAGLSGGTSGGNWRTGVKPRKG